MYSLPNPWVALVAPSDIQANATTKAVSTAATSDKATVAGTRHRLPVSTPALICTLVLVVGQMAADPMGVVRRRRFLQCLITITARRTTVPCSLVMEAVLLAAALATERMQVT
jgi:hypothetical protein